MSELWNKLKGEPGEKLLELLEEMAEKNDGVFSLAEAMEDLYGLDEEDTETIDNVIKENLFAPTLLETVRNAHNLAGIKPTVGSVVLFITLFDSLSKTIKLYEEAKENSKLEEIRNMAKGRLMIVREELDDADVYIAYVPRKNPFEQILAGFPLGLLIAGGGEDE